MGQMNVSGTENQGFVNEVVTKHILLILSSTLSSSSVRMVKVYHSPLRMSGTSVFICLLWSN